MIRQWRGSIYFRFPKVYADDRGESDYYADNPSLRMGMKFDDTAMRLTVKQPIASSDDDDEQKKAARAKLLLDSPTRYRTTEATLRLVGAGYGNRILPTTGEPVMTAEANRFTYHHQLSGQWSAVSRQANGSDHASRITHR